MLDLLDVHATQGLTNLCSTCRSKRLGIDCVAETHVCAARGSRTSMLRLQCMAVHTLQQLLLKRLPHSHHGWGEWCTGATLAGQRHKIVCAVASAGSCMAQFTRRRPWRDRGSPDVRWQSVHLRT